MGNGAVSQDGTVINVSELDQHLKPTVVNKPAQKTSPRGGNKEQGFEQNDLGSKDGSSESKTASKSKSGHRRQSSQVVDEDSGSESEDMEPVDVLLQFIPYYGQGDPSNDSIVRSTLSGLSVEDIDSKDEYGNTLLLLACQYRCEDLVRIMLNKGADPNAVNSSGACCLHFACYRESASFPVAKILLKNGANPDVAETTFGCTPLHYCAGTGDIEFCKLLLAYGAQVNARDYYSYTCVDYATEAGMTELATFLQQKMESTQAKFNLVAKSSFSYKNGSTKEAAGVPSDDISNWESHVDPDSGGKYYIHIKTGECLWENELKMRLQIYQQQQLMQQQVAPPSQKVAPPPTTPVRDEQALITQAVQARLVVFFTQHDPARLHEVESLVRVFKGREQELLNELCIKYKVTGDSELRAFQTKLNELRPQQPAPSPTPKPALRGSMQFTSAPATDRSQIDPLLMQELLQEERKKFDTRIEEELAALKKKYETQIDEDKQHFRSTLSEKEKEISQMQSDIDAMKRAKNSTEEDVKAMEAKLASIQHSGGSALTSLQEEIDNARSDNSALKQQLAEAQQQLRYETEKLTSLESTMHSLTAGKEELIEKERAAAEERASHQREREAQHSAELKELDDKARAIESKLRNELAQVKAEAARAESELKDEATQMRKGKEREIDALSRELAEVKAQFAQEISAANMKIEDMQVTVEDCTRRAEEAEAFQRAVQEELAEAKVVQKYNGQLHKDLQREQLARKKLHNDMEDLKGKIRVYVRVRPFSKREIEKKCEEAVVKDGKMSVLVKGIGGPDQKKFYDFDQVFGGSEGNTQMDVFKDTKHLCMSVVDGYNVCIFAYGQTGAGKSFTMIGAADIATCLNENGDFDELAGITPRAVSELFRLLDERSAQVEYKIDVQMFQLYRDGLEDLLKEDPPKGKKDDNSDNKKKPATLKITLAEHSPTGLVVVDGAVSRSAQSPADVMKIFALGSARRTTASTQMNAESSRSHLICALVVRLFNRRTGKESTGKLTLVDLAGSERVDKSGAAGEMLKEAQSINKSLSALGDVISALTTNSQHVPYRNHPLTMLMSDSIGGNAKTLMFVNTSPADYNAAESNSALGFASRCKDVTNAVAATPAVQAAQVNALKKELAKLKKQGGKGAAPPMGAQLARPDTAAGGRSKA